MLATREQLIDYGATVIIDAYEGGSSGTASWAVSAGDYKWSTENGDYELGKTHTGASVTLYDTEDSVLSPEDDPMDGGAEGKDGYRSWTGDWYTCQKPRHINAEMVADFIVKVGKGEIDFDKVPEYGRLGDRTLKALLFMYHGREGAFDDWDCINADAVVQFILLGEVVYG